MDGREVVLPQAVMLLHSLGVDHVSVGRDIILGLIADNCDALALFEDREAINSNILGNQILFPDFDFGA